MRFEYWLVNSFTKWRGNADPMLVTSWSDVIIDTQLYSELSNYKIG